MDTWIDIWFSHKLQIEMNLAMEKWQQYAEHGSHNVRASWNSFINNIFVSRRGRIIASPVVIVVTVAAEE